MNNKNKPRKQFSQRENEIKDEMREVFGRKKRSKKKIGLITLAVIAAVMLYLYFFIISPVFVSKPEIPKPFFEGQVDENHISWMVNELGGYKLHSSFSAEAPVIEVIIDNLNFAVTTVDNNVIATPGIPNDPDIRIIATIETFSILYYAENIITEAAILYEDGRIQIELLEDMTTLMAKGYMAIYNVIGG